MRNFVPSPEYPPILTDFISPYQIWQDHSAVVTKAATYFCFHYYYKVLFLFLFLYKNKHTNNARAVSQLRNFQFKAGA